MSPSETSVILAIIGLLAWIAKLTLPYFLKKLDEKDAHIEKITNEFRDTINHKQTEFKISLDRLSRAIEKQTEMITKLVRND